MRSKILTLPTVATDTLDVVTNPYDLRRDLHTFIAYVGERNIKRTYRGNELPPADFKRLAQLLHVSQRDEDDQNLYWHSVEAVNWVDYVDQVALRLGLTTYDTKGEYRGYSSDEPSFRENYIVVNDERYRAFLAEQEQWLFDTLVADFDYSRNEFYQRSVLGRLDRFSQAGSAIGIMPTLDFAAIRRLLFGVLQGCQPGVWQSTAALVDYLKAEYPFAIIPQHPGPNKFSRLPEKRYGNFSEENYSRDAVPDDAPDGYERVEGRYIERFLEGIPLALGYVAVAYTPARLGDKVSRGLLRAFRIGDRFVPAMTGTIPAPRVIIQPNFEIYVESAFYPAALIKQLTPLADTIREDTVSIFKLQKQKVAAHLAEHEGSDVVALLQTVSGRALPQNVQVELQEWAGAADIFTVYDGFGLVEAADDLAAIDAFTVATIGDALRLVRQPATVLQRLRDAEAVVIGVTHPDQGLQPLPAKAHTIFPRAIPIAPPKVKKVKPAVTVLRTTQVVLTLPDNALFDRFYQALSAARCIVASNREQRSITVAGQHEGEIKRVIKALGDDYSIRLEERA